MSADTATSIDPDVYRRTLSCFATGAVVICAETADGPAGMTCNSFTSVSLDPPLVAFCPSKTSTTWPRIRSAGHFCISVLGAHQEATSRLFASRESDRFAQAEIERRRHGPGIADAIAWIECSLEAEHDAGDHFVVIGNVEAVETRDGPPPLVFWKSRYGSFKPDDDGTVKPSSTS